MFCEKYSSGKNTVCEAMACLVRWFPVFDYADFPYTLLKKPTKMVISYGILAGKPCDFPWELTNANLGFNGCNML